jgi:hypothetical protein
MDKEKAREWLEALVEDARNMHADIKRSLEIVWEEIEALHKQGVADLQKQLDICIDNSTEHEMQELYAKEQLAELRTQMAAAGKSLENLRRMLTWETYNADDIDMMRLMVNGGLKTLSTAPKEEASTDLHKERRNEKRIREEG